MNTNFSYLPNSHLLQYPQIQNATTHNAELAKLARNRNKTWIQLDSTLIQTRFSLKVVQVKFQSSESDASIQYILQTYFSTDKLENGENSFNQFFLVAQPNTDRQFYNITDYIQRCLEGDISVAERLRGRTVLYFYQSDENTYDLLSDSGVNEFINRVLISYIETYGTEVIFGFAVELPRFLSVFEADGISIPWSSTLLEHLQEQTFKDSQSSSSHSRGGFLPFLFYDKYNSPVIRSVYWQELTSQFARCFLGGVRNFCHQHDIRLAVTIRESAKSLQYELGTLLDQADCPILVSADSDTSRRLVVVKSVCSNAQHAGILRKDPITISQFTQDTTFGFNAWISNTNRKDITNSFPPDYIFQTLQKGNPMRPILMLSPTQSLWMKPEEKQWNSITKAWGWLCETVWNLGYDYDIVPEVQFFDATVDMKEGIICLNGKNYGLVLIPSCLSLHETTVKLLTKFTKAKGRLIVDAPTPYLLNGRIGLEPYLLERLIFSWRTTILDGPEGERETEIRKLLRKWVNSTISVYVGQENQPTELVQVHHRVHGKCYTYFLFNTTNKPIGTLVEIVGEAAMVEEHLLLSGKQRTTEFWYADGKTYLKCRFEAEQGRFFVVS